MRSAAAAAAGAVVRCALLPTCCCSYQQCCAAHCCCRRVQGCLPCARTRHELQNQAFAALCSCQCRPCCTWLAARACRQHRREGKRIPEDKVWGYLLQARTAMPCVCTAPRAAPADAVLSTSAGRALFLLTMLSACNISLMGGPPACHPSKQGTVCARVCAEQSRPHQACLLPPAADRAGPAVPARGRHHPPRHQACQYPGWRPGAACMLPP